MGPAAACEWKKGVNELCEEGAAPGLYLQGAVNPNRWAGAQRKQKSVVRAGKLDLCSEAEVRELNGNKLLQPWVILACCSGVVAKGLKTEL